MNRKHKSLFMLIAVVTVLSFQTLYNSVPNHLLLQEGESYSFPPMISASSQSKPNIAQLKLFGIIPFRTVKVDILEKTELIPCGNAIGIHININGVMVVGISDIHSADGKKSAPTKDSGIKEGDVIRKINNEDVTKTEQLIKMVENCEGNSLSLKIERNNELIDTEVKPTLSKDDNKYKIGAWVRDSTSGIGTITFINPKNNNFGALGHGITDVDTGKIIPAGDGEILYSNIIGIKKGERGTPGELRGVFSGSKKLGNVKDNTSIGVYGKMEKPFSENQPILPVATRSQIKLGTAYILSNIESNKVEKYSIEIQKIMKTAINNKGMIIKVTDEKLIKKTGGIVQGMSGSPIIQDDKIVGAVTHVFINDPTRGYGTFIELMLNNTLID